MARSLVDVSRSADYLDAVQTDFAIERRTILDFLLEVPTSQNLGECYG